MSQFRCFEQRAARNEGGPDLEDGEIAQNELRTGWEKDDNPVFLRDADVGKGIRQPIYLELEFAIFDPFSKVMIRILSGESFRCLVEYGKEGLFGILDGGLEFKGPQFITLQLGFIGV